MQLQLENFLPYRLSVASNLASEAIARGYMRMFGLPIPQWRVVALLAEHDTATQHQLVTLSRMDKMSISRAVRPLVERGLIDRILDEADGRAWRLSLSGAGRDLYNKVVPEARRLEAELLGELSKSEKATLDKVLRKIEHAALRLT